MPDGLFLLAAVLLLEWGGARVWVDDFAPVYPAIFLIGVLQCWRFHRIRLMFALIVLAMADRILLEFATGDAAAVGVGHFVFNAVAVLVPLNLLVIGSLPDRGPFTLQGFALWGAIIVQPALIVRVVRTGNTAIPELFDARFFGESSLTWTSLPHLSFLIYFIAFFLFLVLFIWKMDTEHRTFFWALIASFLALSVGSAGLDSTTYLAAASLMIVVTVIDTSYRLAYRDALTGLSTRRGFNEALEQMIGHWTVAMVDVDHFKNFNDKHGHDVGDQVLKMVAGQVAQVSGGGKAFRYGGEEFVVLFPGKKVEQTQDHLENLRGEIAGRVFVIRSWARPKRKPEKPKPTGKRQTLKITVSIGAADNTDPREIADDVVKAADQALYAAKQAGRNRVRIRAKPKI